VALELVRALEAEDRLPNAGEKRLLAQYTGWGHSPQVFDEIKAIDWEAHQRGHYTYGNDPEGLKNWADRFHGPYLALRDLLSSEEWSRAEGSILNAHDTSREVVVHGLWGIVRRLGFDGGKILENSAGIGHVIGLAPEYIAAESRFTACELDIVTGRMLKLLYPQATVHVMGFQDAKIPAHSQDLVVGNFPFNKQGWPSDKYPFSLHNQFFARSLDLTVPGGLIVAIAYDEVHDSNTGKPRYVKNPERTAAAQDAQQKLKDAYFQWARKSDFVPEIEAEYNAIRNAYRQRQWEPADFRHFPNSSTTVELRPHQKTSVARNMVESNLMAHPVGSGKTYVYATTAMEWKRLGLASKPAIAVLKSTIGQVQDAFRRLYPQARLLVPGEKDFSRENRQKMLARTPTVRRHSANQKTAHLPVSPLLTAVSPRQG
jgi:hypothetical protein